MNHITAATVQTRDGYHLNPIATIEARQQQSERRQMLAQVARIEARLELERALRRASIPAPAINRDAPVIRSISAASPRTGSHPMATRVEREAPVMATRIRPALASIDADDFGPGDRVCKTAIRVLAVASVVMTVIALLKVAAWL